MEYIHKVSENVVVVLVVLVVGSRLRLSLTSV